MVLLWRMLRLCAGLQGDSWMLLMLRLAGVIVPLCMPLAAMADPSMVVYSNALAVVEFLIGIFSVLMAYFSIDKLLVFLRSISFELRYIGLQAKKIPRPEGEG